MSYRHSDFVTAGPGVGKAIIDAALVNMNGDNVLMSGGLVIERTNIGTGGPDYSFDVPIGTDVNLRNSISDAMLLYGAAGNNASSPNSVAASIESSITILEYIIPDDWTPVTGDSISTSKFVGNATQSSYKSGLKGTGVLQLIISPDGSAANAVNAVSTVATGFTDGTGHWVSRIWNDTTNVINFATSNAAQDVDYKTISWTPLGDPNIPLVSAGIGDTSAIVTIGTNSSGGERVNGSVARSIIIAGTDPTADAAVNFNAADYVNRTSDTEFPSSDTGEPWTLNDSFIQNTGHDVTHTIGGAGFETTLGQLIDNLATAFVVTRFTDTPPTTSQLQIHARSNGAAAWQLFTNNSDSDKFFVNIGSDSSPGMTFDNDAHLHTIQSNGDATSKYTVSGITNVTGDFGSEDWDFGTMFASLTGTNSMKGYQADLVVIERATADKERYDAENYLFSKNRLAA